MYIQVWGPSLGKDLLNYQPGWRLREKNETRSLVKILPPAVLLCITPGSGLEMAKEKVKTMAQGVLTAASVFTGSEEAPGTVMVDSRRSVHRSGIRGCRREVSAAWFVIPPCLLLFGFAMPGTESRASCRLVPCAVKLCPQPCLLVTVMTHFS